MLVADTEPPQSKPKERGGKHRFVVRAQIRGLPIPFKDVEQVTQHGDGRFVSQGGQAEIRPAVMLYDAQQVVKVALRVRLAGQAQTPDQVARNRLRAGVFDLSAQHLNLIQRLTNDAAHPCFADGHLRHPREPPVEGIRDLAAACFGHQRFQANDFALDPLRFGRVATEYCFLEGCFSSTEAGPGSIEKVIEQRLSEPANVVQEGEEAG